MPTKHTFYNTKRHPSIRRLPERGKFYLNASAIQLFGNPKRLCLAVSGPRVEVHLPTDEEPGSKITRHNYLTNTEAWLAWQSFNLENTQPLYVRRYVDATS